MKNLSLLLNGVLAVAVAVLYYLHFKTTASNPIVPAASGQTTAQTGSSAAGGKRIVFINSDSLLTNYQFYKETIQELEAEQGKLDQDLGGRLRALQNEAAALQGRARDGKLSQEEGQRAEQGLMRKQQELEQYRGKLGQQFAENQQKKNQEVYEAITTFLKKRNATTQFDYVLSFAKNGSILFANDNLDVTKAVIDELNREHQSRKVAK